MLRNLWEIIKRRRLVIALVFIITVAFIYGILRARKEATEGPPGPSGGAGIETSEGIRPGITTSSDLQKIRTPREVQENPDGTSTYVFGEKTDPNPDEAVTKDDKVFFFKKRPTQKDFSNISQVVEKYKNPDFTLFSSIPDSIVYVFLDEGLAVTADKDSGVVHELRYFVPTTKEDFIQGWGKDLLSTSPTPPPLYY